MKIFVAGLPYDLDDAELMEIFEKFGEVKSAKVAMDRETGKSRGFAFVDMPNQEEAMQAIENLNDISLGKKPMVVKAAEERPSGGGGQSRPSGPSGGGGFDRRPPRRF
jgi:RNA recognition motif-containing protein